MAIEPVVMMANIATPAWVSSSPPKAWAGGHDFANFPEQNEEEDEVAVGAVGVCAGSQARIARP